MDKSMKKKIVEALHEIYKEKFIGCVLVKSSKDGRRKIKLDPSTKEMDSKEFSEYINKLRIEHPYLPDATDKHLMEFVDRYYYK